MKYFFACNGAPSSILLHPGALAIVWKMELQYYGKLICNFLQKGLAKNKN